MSTKQSLRVKRIAPRIISRSYGEKSKRAEGIINVFSQNHQTSCTVSSELNDVEAELQSEICIKGGMVFSANSKNFTLKLNSDQQTKVFNSYNNEVYFNDLVNEYSLKDQNIRLPGVADEVESYPCPVCGPDKVFLTVSGLQRHSQEIHPLYLENVKSSIEHIQNEWNRRRNFQLSSIKHRFGQKSNESIFDKTNHHQYEVCKLCGAMISTLFAGVMEKHIQIHLKNNELCQNLLQEFGQKFVDSVTCKECLLVFPDENKLIDHILKYHKKRRRFICRWCGKMFKNVANLNSHKHKVHNIILNSKYSNNDDLNFVCVNINNEKILLNEDNESEVLPKYLTKKNTKSMDFFYESSINENTPCRIKCKNCGLTIVKPSLLLRHMLRVHNLHHFDAEILSNFRAPLKFSISNSGKVTWTCCDECFNDRESVLMHRKMMHGQYCLFNNSKPNIENNSNNNSLIQNNDTNEELVLENDLSKQSKN